MASLCQRCVHFGCCDDLHFCGGRWFVKDVPEPEETEGEEDDGEEGGEQ